MCRGWPRAAWQRSLQQPPAVLACETVTGRFEGLTLTLWVQAADERRLDSALVRLAIHEADMLAAMYTVICGSLPLAGIVVKAHGVKHFSTMKQ